MRAISALLYFTALVVSVDAGEMPPADAGTVKEIPVPSNVFIPPSPPMKVKSDYAVVQEAYESKNLQAIDRICQHASLQDILVVNLSSTPPSPWKDEVVLVLLEAPWPGDRVAGKPAPPGYTAPLRSFQLAVDLLSPVLPDENLKMNDRETYAKLSTLNGRKRLAEMLRKAGRKQESPNVRKKDKIGVIPNEDLPKSTKLGAAEEKSSQPVQNGSEIRPQPNKSWIWILVAFIVLASVFVVRRMGSTRS